MSRWVTKIAALGGLLAGIAVGPPGEAQAGERSGHQGRGQPNLLVIVADDLGFSDLGAFGGEISTPNLDALALAGVRFTGLHTAPTCSPTRAMLMTGVDNHLVGLGSMAELLADVQRGQPGYEGYLNRRAATVAELLRGAGYRTLMSGKWHLGLEEDQSPRARGFERSFALLQGVHNHYGIDQDAAWTAVGVNARYRGDDGKPASYPVGAYSADHFADRLLGYLEEGRGDDRPFFAYLAFTQPHWPLQAPEEDVAKYRGRYDAGPEALRQERLARQRALGLVAPGVEPAEPVGVPSWSSLSPEERALEARKMEIYAAMVDRLDRNVGRVVAKLGQLGRLDDTLILFLADNGPEASRIDRPVNDPALLAPLGIDNSLANLGRASSWVTYGPGWAQAASSPSRLFKGFTTEGGTRVVGFASGEGVRGGGRVAGALLHVTDIAPTLLDAAGVQAPRTYGGQPVLAPEGRSLARLLRGRELEVRAPQETVGWELFFRRAVRQGDWKAVYLPGDNPLVPYRVTGREPARWELYDLRRDPGETTDLADRHPRRLRRLVRAWEAYAARAGVVLPPAPSAQAAAAGTTP